MAADPEARAQLARLLEDGSIRGASEEEVQKVVEAKFERLVSGVLAEAAASDDVVDRESGLEFVSARVEDLKSLLAPEQKSRLLDALRGKIEAW